MGELSRVFIAIPIEGEVKWRLEAVLASISESNHAAGVNLVDSGLWHLTLVFLGNQDSSGVEQCKSVLLEAKSLISWRKKLNFGSVIWKENQWGGGIIWLTLSAASDSEVKTVKKIISDRLETSGVKWSRDYRGGPEHVTLARVKHGNCPFDINNPDLKELSGLSFQIERLVLIKSELGPYGPAYSELLSVQGDY